MIAGGLELGWLDGPGKALGAFRVRNDRTKVPVGHVVHSRYADLIDRVQTVFVHTTGFLDAIRRTKDRTWEGRKLKLLILPRRPIIAHKVVELAEDRVPVCR